MEERKKIGLAKASKLTRRRVARIEGKVSTKKGKKISRDSKQTVSERYDFILTQVKRDIDIVKQLNKVASKSFDEDYNNFSKQTKEKMKNFSANEKNQYLRYIKLLKKQKKKDFKKGYVKLSPEVTKIIYEMFKSFYFFNRFKSIMGEMSLVYIVSLFGEYLKDVFLFTLRIEPNILKSSSKTFKLSELIQIKDIEELKNEIVEKEVSREIENGINGMQSFALDKFKIDFKDYVKFKKVEEIFARRNIIIHNRGYPNKRYKERTNYIGKHKRLNVTENYLSVSLNTLELFANFVNDKFKLKFSKKGTIPIPCKHIPLKKEYTVYGRPCDINKPSDLD
jgi:hypothetical protein